MLSLAAVLLPLLPHVAFGASVSASTSPAPMVAYFPLVGNPGCAYAATFDLDGTKMSLLLDSGSSNTAVATTTCPTSQCPVSPLYPFTPASGSSPDITVKYGTASSSSSWSGYLTSSKISFSAYYNGSATTFSASTKIAMITTASSFFNSACSGNDGILGLAYSSIAAASQVPFMDFLNANNVGNSFTLQLCISQRTQNGNRFNTTRSGNMWVGGYDSSFLASGSSFIYTSVIKQSYFQVDLVAYSLGGTVISGMQTTGFSSYDAIIDSGTTLIVMNSNNYNTLMNYLAASSYFKFPTGTTTAQKLAFFQGDSGLSGISSYTSLLSDTSATGFTLTLGDGVVLGLDWSALFAQVGNTIYFTGFGDSGSTTGGTIIGETAFIGKVVLFDRGNSRIGFATAASTKCVSNTGASANVQSINVVVDDANGLRASLAVIALCVALVSVLI